MTLDVWVPGLPRPQGSMRAIRMGNHVRMVNSAHDDLLAWRSALASHLAHVMGDMPPLDVACGLRADFYLPRPASAPKRRIHPDRKPDLDKLTRAVLDSLTGIAVVDDARIVSASVQKHYAVDHPIGAHIALWPIAPAGSGPDDQHAGEGILGVSSDAVGNHQTIGAGAAPPEGSA